ncbi:hypothetical protein DFH08DRAFT_993728 [Mycena albidolilacea]|uniref:Uncharacterized protein n=1 Tax=Mycena albidolilacea TaxID=1033008 RepID=A0AAD7E772_9AGAR|nr:hypothetical protein DFH08DRAFT_993728 [Mycena albidolilacea]
MSRVFQELPSKVPVRLRLQCVMLVPQALSSAWRRIAHYWCFWQDRVLVLTHQSLRTGIPAPEVPRGRIRRDSRRHVVQHEEFMDDKAGHSCPQVSEVHVLRGAIDPDTYVLVVGSDGPPSGFPEHVSSQKPFGNPLFREGNPSFLLLQPSLKGYPIIHSVAPFFHPSQSAEASLRGVVGAAVPGCRFEGGTQLLYLFVEAAQHCPQSVQKGDW